MKIVTPMQSMDYYEPLVEAGANEFYCGYIPYEWLQKYNNLLPLNRREFIIRNSNICTFSSMRILSKMIQKYKIPVKITLNSHYYYECQYPLITNIIKELIDLGFDTFIVADLALIIYLRDKGIDCKLHLSGEVAVVNSLFISFFNQLGISRYIFPRKTTTNEMKSCIGNNEVNNMEYEAFMLNGWCTFSGAFCNNIHCDELTATCSIPYKISTTNYEADIFKEVSNELKEVSRLRLMLQKAKASEDKDDNSNQEYIKNSNYILGKTGCGLCKIKELAKLGITHLKVIGRDGPLEALINDIKLINKIIQMSETLTENELFTAYVKQEFHNRICPVYCYYPKT